jgi:PilZ domain
MITSLLTRRRESRVPCSVPVVCQVTDATGERHLLDGASVNLSRHGVAVIVPKALHRADLICMTLQHSGCGLPYERSARVVYRRPCPSGWVIGFEFHEPLTECELEQLAPHQRRRAS